jgi:hypothetical protein
MGVARAKEDPGTDDANDDFQGKSIDQLKGYK